METQNSSIESMYKTTVIVWAAIFFSQILLLVVIYFAKPEIFRFDFSKPVLGENALMVILFGAMALVNVGMSIVLSRRAVNQAIEKQNPALMQSAIVLGCAFCEAASLLGVVMAFAFSYQYFFVWFIVGGLAMLLHFPKRDDFIHAGYKR